jgi:hypothetical protein
MNFYFSVTGSCEAWKTGYTWARPASAPATRVKNGGPPYLVPGEPDPAALVRHLGQVLVRLPHGRVRQESQGPQGSAGRQYWSREGKNLYWALSPGKRR